MQILCRIICKRILSIQGTYRNWSKPCISISDSTHVSASVRDAVHQESFCLAFGRRWVPFSTPVGWGRNHIVSSYTLSYSGSWGRGIMSLESAWAAQLHSTVTQGSGAAPGWKTGCASALLGNAHTGFLCSLLFNTELFHITPCLKLSNVKIRSVGFSVICWLFFPSG